MVALAYADHARDGASAWLTLVRLGERTGLSRRSATTARQNLIAAGWLVEIKKASHHRAAVYRLAIPRVAADATLAAAGVHETQPGWQQETPRVAADATNLISNPSTSLEASGSGREDEVLDNDDVLALFSASHPGRERDAATAASKLFETRFGETPSPARLVGYYRKFTTDQLAQRISVAARQQSRCATCAGEGWLYPNPADASAAVKCDHQAIA